MCSLLFNSVLASNESLFGGCGTKDLPSSQALCHCEVLVPLRGSERNFKMFFSYPNLKLISKVLMMACRYYVGMEMNISSYEL